MPAPVTGLSFDALFYKGVFEPAAPALCWLHPCIITGVGGLLTIPLVANLLYHGHMGWAVLVVFIADLLDCLDGCVARGCGLGSTFGKYMDEIVDTIRAVSVGFCAVWLLLRYRKVKKLEKAVEEEEEEEYNRDGMNNFEMTENVERDSYANSNPGSNISYNNPASQISRGTGRQTSSRASQVRAGESLETALSPAKLDLREFLKKMGPNFNRDITYPKSRFWWLIGYFLFYGLLGLLVILNLGSVDSFSWLTGGSDEAPKKTTEEAGVELADGSSAEKVLKSTGHESDNVNDDSSEESENSMRKLEKKIASASAASHSREDGTSEKESKSASDLSATVDKEHFSSAHEESMEKEGKGAHSHTSKMHHSHSKAHSESHQKESHSESHQKESHDEDSPDSPSEETHKTPASEESKSDEKDEEGGKKSGEKEGEEEGEKEDDETKPEDSEEEEESQSWSQFCFLVVQDNTILYWPLWILLIKMVHDKNHLWNIFKCNKTWLACQEKGQECGTEVQEEEILVGRASRSGENGMEMPLRQ